MAEDRQLTPEKQLLRLIEESKAPSAGPVRPARLRPEGLDPLSWPSLLGMILGRFSFLKRSVQKFAASAKFSVELSFVNKVLMIMILCFSLYGCFDVIAAAISLRMPPNFSSKNEAESMLSDENASPLKDTSFYTEKVTSRDIFKEDTRSFEQKKNHNGIFSTQSNPMTKNLTLVGISWSSSPDVLLEDKTVQKTYFAKQGQIIGGGVKIESIFRDHVVLSVGGKEFELR